VYSDRLGVIAGCIQLKPSPCDEENPANAGDGEDRRVMTLG